MRTESEDDATCDPRCVARFHLTLSDFRHFRPLGEWKVVLSLSDLEDCSGFFCQTNLRFLGVGSAVSQHFLSG